MSLESILILSFYVAALGFILLKGRQPEQKRFNVRWHLADMFHVEPQRDHLYDLHPSAPAPLEKENGRQRT